MPQNLSRSVLHTTRHSMTRNPFLESKSTELPQPRTLQDDNHYPPCRCSRIFSVSHSLVSLPGWASWAFKSETQWRVRRSSVINIWASFDTRVGYFTDLGGHAIAMTVFGYAGYWAYKWDGRAAEMIAQKRAEITERRETRLAAAQGADSDSDSWCEVRGGVGTSGMSTSFSPLSCHSNISAQYKMSWKV